MTMAGVDHLFFRARGVVCALPLASVVETMRPLPITPLENMPAFVSGLAVVRGTPTPVVDASRLLGAGESSPARFVTVRTERGVLALAVDEVIAIEPLTAERRESMPSLLRDAASGLVHEIGVRDHDLLALLRSARILTDEAWSAIDAERSR